MKRLTHLVLVLSLGGLVGAVVVAPWLQGQVPMPPAVPKELTTYSPVVKRVLPAVVSIEAKAQGGKRRTGEAEDARKFFDEFRPQPFTDGTIGFGSGFLVDPKGVVLTNHHVLSGADFVEVTLADGRKFTSKDVKSDAKADLAIVRIETKTDLPFLELGDSDAMEVGDRVLAVGAPFGLTGSVTSGIVSAKGRSLHTSTYEDFLQTDAAINPGNSGGPLVNLEGKVIGITSAIKSRSGGFQGVGLAISSRLAQAIMDPLLRDGVVKRGYLGVQVKDLTDPELVQRFGAGAGVVVTQVLPNSPGARAGLQEGDVITTLAGQAVKDSRDLQRTIALHPVNKGVKLTVVRDKQERSVDATIEEQPADSGTRTANSPRTETAGAVRLDKAGLEVADLTPDLAERFGFHPRTVGAVVVSVDGDGPALRAGLRRGMWIIKLEKQVIRSTMELRDGLDAQALERGVLLQVRSPQGDSAFVLLKAK